VAADLRAAISGFVEAQFPCSVLLPAATIPVQPMQDDIELLRQYAQAGAEAAFTELVQRHVNLVCSAALRRVGGDAHLAEDVTQQVFAALARQASPLSQRATLTGWLYTTARFAAARVIRAERRRQAREQEAYIMQEDSTPDPDWDRLRPVLDQAMDRLNEREREVLLLRFFEGRAFAQMAARLSLTEDAARMRTDRALEKLRPLLARLGVNSTSAAVALMLGSQAVTAAPAGLTVTIAGNSLAASGGVTGTASYFLQIMSTSKLTFVAAAAFALSAIGTATHEVLASRESAAALIVARQDLLMTQGTLRRLERRAVDAEQSRVDLQGTIEATRRTRAEEEARAAKIAAESAATIKDPIAAGEAFVAAHPAAPEMVTDYNRARTLERYGLLFQRLGFTRTQIEQFQQLIAQGPSSGLGWHTAEQAPIACFNVGPVGFTNAEMEDRIHGLLGDSGYQQYQEFNRLAPAREFVTGLAGMTASTAAPMTSAQAYQLTQILAQNSPDYRDGKRVNSDSIDWDAVLPAAEKFLSPQQLVSLGNLRLQTLYQKLLGRAANQAEGDAMKALAQNPPPSPGR